MKEDNHPENQIKLKYLLKFYNCIINLSYRILKINFHTTKNWSISSKY
jgi:hypothetical protein